MLAPGGATGAADDPPMHEPGSRETALVERGSVVLVCDGQRHELARGRLRDLRRRPAAPLREPRRPRRPPSWRSSSAGLTSSRQTERMSHAKTLFEKIWEAHEVARRACSTSTCISCTRSRARRRSTACASRGAACAARTARSRPPTTTRRPTGRCSPRASRTSSRACRCRRSSATARSSASPSTRSARTARGSCT